jgi:hypothetical protein
MIRLWNRGHALFAHTFTPTALVGLRKAEGQPSIPPHTASAVGVSRLRNNLRGHSLLIWPRDLLLAATETRSQRRKAPKSDRSLTLVWGAT